MAEIDEDERADALPRPRQRLNPVWLGTAGFGKEMPALAESVGFLVRIVQLQSFQLFYRRFESAGLSTGALIALGAIHANPGIRHGVLADALMIKRPNFTKVINGLERDGLIVREAPRGDKRTTALLVTKKGARKLESMRHAVLDHLEETVAPLSRAERDVLIDLLRRLSQHLQGLLERQGAGAKPNARADLPAK